MLNCSRRFARAWQQLEAKAAGAGASCPDDPLDPLAVTAIIDQCTDDVAHALGGGGVPDCRADLVACGNDLDQCTLDLAASAACGNAVVDDGEECDQGNVDDQTCAALGFISGTLRCGAGCSFDTSGCVGARFEDTGLTIVDHRTGLEWEKKTNLDGVDAFCPGGGPSCDDPHDADNRYQFSTSNPAAPNGAAFDVFLFALNDCVAGDDLAVTGGFAGHCDWRLPTISELRSIVNTGVAGCGTGTVPCIDPVFGPTNPSFANYVSTTLHATLPYTLWDVSFRSGQALRNEPGKQFYVRAVRRAAEEPNPCGNGVIEGAENCDLDNLNTGTCATEGFLSGTLACAASCTYDTSGCSGTRYVDNGDGTVTDHLTGLQWEQKSGVVGSATDCSASPCPDLHDVNNRYPWCLDADGNFTCDGPGYPPDGDAFTSFLAGLNTPPCFAGHCDWRLPSVAKDGGSAELETIVKATAPGCRIGSVCIDPIFGPTFIGWGPSSPYSSPYWSATEEVASPANAWLVDFGRNAIEQFGKVFPVSVRAVRTAP